jgi:hypothetical protein
VQTHECVRTCEGKNDQILRIEMLVGGETGGEWMSASLTDRPHSVIAVVVELGSTACRRTSAQCLEPSSDELLIAGK